jgi:hypothetical protein
MAAGVQPFASIADLESITVPTLVIPGNDLMHPPEIAELYTAKIPQCIKVELSATADHNSRNAAIAEAICEFCEQKGIW